MKYNQNFKISQITNNTLVIGVDIAKKKHYARAFDYRGITDRANAILYFKELGF
jgi:transposase